jgi:hypothetical protein
MPTLSGKQSRSLSEALDDAFDSVEALDEFLWEMLGKRLHNVAYGGDAQVLRFKLIRKADAEGWVLRLIAAACEARPASGALRQLAAEAGLSAAPADLAEAVLAGSSLERVILEDSPFLDVSAWRVRLGELEAQVCRVEVPAGTRSTAGTGFLVGPGLVLTNYHVVGALHRSMADPGAVRLRFDYKATPDGTQVSEGTTYRLADDWLAAWRPPSAVDDLPAPGDKLPGPGELDFAVLRVAGAPGEEPIGRAGLLAGAPDRGWIRLDPHGPDGGDAGYPLLILQHPSDEPLKLAFGQSAGLNANRTRLRHQVSTRRGSSGSPCLNTRLEVVALHHAGDPNFDPAHKPAWNAAIPIAAIRDCLDAGHLLALRAGRHHGQRHDRVRRDVHRGAVAGPADQRRPRRRGQQRPADLRPVSERDLHQGYRRLLLRREPQHAERHHQRGERPAGRPDAVAQEPGLNARRGGALRVPVAQLVIVGDDARDRPPVGRPVGPEH